MSLSLLQVVKLPAGRQEHPRNDDDQLPRTQVNLQSHFTSEHIQDRATVMTTKQDQEWAVWRLRWSPNVGWAHGAWPRRCFTHVLIPQVSDPRLRWIRTHHRKLRLPQEVQVTITLQLPAATHGVPLYVCFKIKNVFLSCSLSGCPRAKKSGIKILHSKEDKDDQEPIK